MMNLKRWFVFTLTGVALASLLAVAASFALIYKARADAARYLGIVMPIQIGTPYDVVATQLRDAGTPMKLLGDCNHKCRIEFGVNDEWLHRLYIAPAARFFGTLEFKDAKLSSKTTGMHSRMRYGVSVVEAASLEFGKVLSFDSSGVLSYAAVYLAASDFTENRANAYAFDLRCVGFTKGCRSDEYLPRSSSISLVNVTVHLLDDENPQAEQLGDRLFHLPEIQGWLQDHGCVREHYVVKAGIYSGGGLPRLWKQFSIHAREVPLSALMSEVAARANTDGWYVERNGTGRCTVDIGWGSVQDRDKR